ncbi:MAG: transcriptional repressor [Lachnospiraceae bacterium]|nr:transcriptional repressor [Lachnospiraceae bacterium]
MAVRLEKDDRYASFRAEYSSESDRKQAIIRRLREMGCRITRQRIMILDIIMHEDCSCCKEIYYKAAEQDPGIGFATVYRMVNTLEEAGVISRRNMYRIECGEECVNNGYCLLEFSDDTKQSISREHLRSILQAGLIACGYAGEGKEIRGLVLNS